MFERLRRDEREFGERGAATRHREPEPGERHGGGARAAGAAEPAGAATAAEREHVGDRRQRDEFGGFNIGAAFFGWLVAIGMAVLLTALLSAAGAAIGLTEVSESEAEGAADAISIGGAILLLLVLMLAYYCGGYVAGRMSRFDGGRQGIGVWAFGLIVTLLLAAAGAIAGAEYNVLQQLNLPRIPVDEGDLATGGAIALAAFVLGTLLAAFLGGKAGRRYHGKVDRAAYAG